MAKMGVKYLKPTHNIILMRKNLILRILERIEECGITKKEAARISEVNESRIHNLKVANYSLYTLEPLLRILEKLGHDITMNY